MEFHIDPIDKEMMEAAQARQKNLAKPFGSLGLLEKFSMRIAGITGQMFPCLSGKAMVVFAADNGVFEEGVTPIGQDVTALQSANMTFGKAGIGVLSAHANAKLFVVDVGMAFNCESRYVIRRKIRRGTSNIAKGPAMSEEECRQALSIGAEMAQLCQSQGCSLVGAGEMGVGNTTTSTAVISALTGLPPSSITGKGAGLTNEAYANKISVIERALSVNQPNRGDALDVLRKVGGFDLVALTGFYLEAARLHLVCVVDGFIAVAAALAAKRLNPLVCDYLFLSHRSAEPGYDDAVRELGLAPMLDMGMRLGEGTGCPLAFNILEASVRVLRDMATFDEISINQDVIVDNWEEDKGRLGG